MNDKIFEHENQNLNKTLGKIKNAKNELEHSLESIGQENLSKLKDLRENPETSGLDFYLFMEELHNENTAFNVKDKYKRLDEMTYLEREPYFARIDLEDSSSKDELYIGKFGYTEEKPVVTDWRAKIASVYYRYRYPQKNVKYTTPDGEVITNLTLKRTFEIESGELIKYYNNDIQLDESEIISEKIEQRTGGVLEDIIETIQESQLDIIEADPRQICIVQGCVGSGKSTVAIHKLSHIFFNFPDTVKPERSIVVAKNQILVGYLSTLFPKLGIFDTNYKALKDLLVQVIFREELKIDYDLSLGQNTEAFNLETYNKFNSKLNRIHEKVEKELNKLFSQEDFEGFGGFVYSKKDSPYQNLSESISDLEEELDLQKEAYKENPKSIRALLHKENIKTLKKLITKIKKMRIDLVNQDLKKLVKEFGINESQKLNYSQTLIYTLAYLNLIGLRKFRKYEYCIVDEGQDFSILEYSFLGNLVIHGRFCILGDLNQSYAEAGILNWEQISEVIEEAKRAQVFQLDTNYRSTKPIIDLARSILAPYTQDYLPNSINRKGAAPNIEYFDSGNEMLAKFEEDILKELKNIDKSIGVICFSPESYEFAQKLLNDSIKQKDKLIELDENTKIHYIPKGVYLTKFENSKGLEFSKVYVLDLNLDKLTNFLEAKRAFVAVTRAMNEVTVYGQK